MDGSIDHIDNYFNNALSPEERAAFEQRCLDDERFAEEVAWYIASRQQVQQELDEQRKERWQRLETESRQEQGVAKVVSIKKWLGWAVATACIVAITFMLWTSPENNLRKDAGRYIADNLQTISVSMGKEGDSLQQAINLYNSKEYKKAITIFNWLIKKNPAEVYAIQYRGLSYLMMKNYDAAIADFDALSNHSELTVNPGYFYKAVTLLQRNQPNDAVSARKLLQYIVDEKKEGWKEGEKWLKE